MPISAHPETHPLRKHFGMRMKDGHRKLLINNLTAVRHSCRPAIVADRNYVSGRQLISSHVECHSRSLTIAKKIYVISRGSR